jgi:hypothetical protein
MSYYKKLTHFYKGLALILLNTCVLFLFLNFCLSIIFLVKDQFFRVEEIDPVSARYGSALLKKAYPDLSEETISDLLAETWSRPYIYESFTQFRERPSAGTYVNVDENGFRVTKQQGPWPVDQDKYNIFLFGGSTTFGYGLPDDQTVASYLQDKLSSQLGRDVRVYNFGRGFYYSSQERILLEKLLASGSTPDLVIFIDGLNEFFNDDDEPFFTNRLEQFFDNGTAEATFESELLKKLPIARAANALKRRLEKSFSDQDSQIIQDHDQDMVGLEMDARQDETTIINVIQRYQRNKKLIEAIAAVYGVQAIFVWQPIPTYRYDLTYHLFIGDGFEKHHFYAKYGYEYLANHKNSLGDNFLWGADIQENLHYKSHCTSIKCIIRQECPNY